MSMHNSFPFPVWTSACLFDINLRLQSRASMRVVLRRLSELAVEVALAVVVMVVVVLVATAVIVGVSELVVVALLQT